MFCMKLGKKHQNWQIKEKKVKEFIKNSENIQQSQLHWTVFTFLSNRISSLFFYKLNLFPPLQEWVLLDKIFTLAADFLMLLSNEFLPDKVFHSQPCTWSRPLYIPNRAFLANIPLSLHFVRSNQEISNFLNLHS